MLKSALRHLLCLLFLWIGAGQAAEHYSRLYVFGDSLSPGLDHRPVTRTLLHEPYQ